MHKVDKLVEELLGIESSAKDSLKDLEHERAALPQMISEEIARRTLEIKRKEDQSVQALKQEAEEAAQAQLDEIESKYQQKAAQLKELFEANSAAWRKEWVSRVLQITP